MNDIKIGWGEESIVPEGRKVNLAGQFFERISDTVETPIAVTALAIESGDDAVIFCACDLVAVGKEFIERIRGKLKDEKGLPADKIIVSAIHTHTAPSFKDSVDAITATSSLAVLTQLMPNAKYEALVSYSGSDLLAGEEAAEFIAERAAKAIKTAWNSKSAGSYAAGFGRAAVGMNRRVCYSDGSAKMWGNTDTATFTELEAGNDSGIELLYTFDDNKKLTGVIANVACPAQVLEHRSFISSDYFGKVKRNLRKLYGDNVNLLGIVSPAGDQCPRDMIRWVEPETPIDDPNIIRNNVTVRKADPSMFDIKGCELVARRITNEIVYAYENIEDGDYVREAELVHKNLTIDMPLRRVTPEQVEIATRAIKEFAKEIGDKPLTFKETAAMHVHAGTILRGKLQETVDVIPIEVHVLKLGSIAFATNPYELFLDYGNQMRARSKASQTFLIQLACGCVGYLPTEKAEQGSHYSAYVSSGTAGHEGGDLLVRKTVAEINEMF